MRFTIYLSKRDRDFKHLRGRTASGKTLREKAFNIA